MITQLNREDVSDVHNSTEVNSYVLHRNVMHMEDILKAFDRYPSQKDVVRVMLKLGLSVKDNSAYCGNVEISDSALGRAANVDRRVVRSTIERIMATPELLRKFSKLRSMCLLSEIATEIGCSTLEIIPTNSQMPGILADVTKTIFDAGVSVRQAVIDDSSEGNAKLIVVIQGQLPATFIPRIKLCRGVDSVILR